MNKIKFWLLKYFFPIDEYGLAKSKMDKFIFFENSWNTGAGTVGQVKNLISDFLFAGVILKIFNITQYWWLLPIFGITYVIGVIALGLFLIKKNIVGRRGSWANRLANPQLMRILEKVEKDDK